MLLPLRSSLHDWVRFVAVRLSEGWGDIVVDVAVGVAFVAVVVIKIVVEFGTTLQDVTVKFLVTVVIADWFLVFCKSFLRQSI